MRHLRTDTRGAVMVEHLITFAPIMFMFFATWQLTELWAASLVLQRAASAAARAAVVVLPDDPAFYDGVAEDSYSGKKRSDVELAAALILATNPHFSSDYSVDVQWNGDDSLLSATVKAKFHCTASWVSLVCGGESRELTAKATQAYQGAPYLYDM